MFKALHIVQLKDVSISGRHVGHGATDVESVDYAGLHQITGAEATAGALFRNIFHQEIERDDWECTLSQVHQHSVDGQPVKPRSKC